MIAFVALTDSWVFLQSTHVLKDSRWSFTRSLLEMSLPEMPSEPTHASLPIQAQPPLRLVLGLCASLFYTKPTLRQSQAMVAPSPQINNISSFRGRNPRN